MLVRLIFVGASPYMLWRLFRRPEYRKGLAQKLGFGFPVMPRPTIWVHAVSVGEVMAAEPLIKKLAATGKPLVLSVTTPTGRELAEQRMGDIATVVSCPLDLPGAVNRAVDALDPKLLIVIDTELWPNLFWRVKEQGGRVAMVNGRISDRSAPRYQKLSFFFGHVLEAVDLFLMQSDQDAERIAAIGANRSRVEVVGNLKFDGQSDAVPEDERVRLKRSLGIGPDERLIFLGSVHEGEEASIRAALSIVSRMNNVRLVIAPRRIKNIGWIERALDGSAHMTQRRSESSPEPSIDKNMVPIVDTFGELARLYAVADIVFVGGSLINHGGQNPLEPAAHGVTTLFGPYMSNFRDAAAALVEAGGAVQVDSHRLVTEMEILLSDHSLRGRIGDAAKRVVDKNRGVTEQVARRLMELLDE